MPVIAIRNANLFSTKRQERLPSDRISKEKQRSSSDRHVASWREFRQHLSKRKSFPWVNFKHRTRHDWQNLRLALNRIHPQRYQARQLPDRQRQRRFKHLHDRFRAFKAVSKQRWLSHKICDRQITNRYCMIFLRIGSLGKRIGVKRRSDLHLLCDHVLLQRQSSLVRYSSWWSKEKVWYDSSEESLLRKEGTCGRN